MKEEVRFIDLFAGMGGLRIGFEQAFNEKGIGTKCVLTSEIKSHAIEALEANFEHEKLVGDITQINENEIEDFDFLLAGFPCQPFSSAGNRLGFDDTRGTLFFDVARILRAKEPYGFILENVEGLVKHDLLNKSDEIGNTLNVILNVLKEMEYNVEWKLLDSKDFGVAQSRNRVYIVGTKKGRVNLDNFKTKRVALEEILQSGLETVDSHFTRCLLANYTPEELYGKAIKDKRGGKDNIHSWDIGLKGEVTDEQKNLLESLFRERRKKKWAEEIGIKWMDGMPLTFKQIQTFNNSENLKEMLDDLVSKGYLKMEYPKDEMLVEVNNVLMKKRVQDETKEIGYNIVAGKLSFEFTKILNPKEITPTLVAMDVSKLGVVDNGGIRSLSLREGLRLCGYPETYSLDFLKNKRNGFDLLGNTVVINVVHEVASRVAQTYIDSNKK